ncbi:NAD(P)-dependent oxidoreductase [Leifsonia sp. F6_8S_P_1B]|uniref:NAD(P)-dependent oxidoreductase n=1 Tax=Leifsonia williamsii TaxID=3035919 RepID=A0ABT8K7U0_9MICO|nr:NAD(P)-dependent oxidoreductase [Leifsonia williamsii]MDN4613523.1 NAD(P)-dependent oxidoreductase [Leifsonia williamsii]
MALIAITGGSGRIGHALAPRLVADGHAVRAIDTEPVEGADWEQLSGSILDVSAMTEAFAGADLVVHLAGHPAEEEWAELLSLNIDGTRAVLEAAQAAGVRRVLLASSIHAVGFETGEAIGRGEPLLPRPDGYYGVTKAVMESLGSLYADRFGMTVVSARICAFGEMVPDGDLAAASWFSADDATRLVEAVAALDRPGHSIVWGVSANRSGWFPLGEGAAIGFHPQDDAEEALARDGRSFSRPEPTGPIGGPFTTVPLGEPMP